MVDISGLIKQVGLDMQNQTREELMSYLDTISNRMSQWLIKAKAYQEFQNSHLQQGQKEIEIGNMAKKYFEKFFEKGTYGNISDQNIANERQTQALQERVQLEIEAQQRLQNASNKTISKSVLLEGYDLLNSLGESIQGGPIEYSITVNSQGWGSETTTWIVNYDVFKTLLTSSRTRLIMKDPSSIQTELTNIKGITWEEETIAAYEAFHTEAIQNGKLYRGNTLEAFFLQRSYQRQGKQLSVQDAIDMTLHNTKPFYAGGDIDSYQIKGPYASVTNIGTLINQMYRTFNEITKIKQRITKLANNPPPADRAIKINESINKQIIKLLSQYGFSPG